MRLPPATEEWFLPTHELGRRTLVYAQVESTNTLALQAGDEPDVHGLAILAREQTGGRGQHGRVWNAPPNSSVLLSLILHPPQELRRPVLLTAWAAVSVCALIQEFAGIPCRIKWPNDVFLRGRKVCGILIEQSRSTVVGIGLNVVQPAEWFAHLGLTEGTSLIQHGVTADTDTVARRLLSELDRGWQALSEGELHLLESQWKWHLGLLGQLVRIETATESCTGRLLEIGFDGLLLAEGNTIPRQIACEPIRQIVRLESEALQ